MRAEEIEIDGKRELHVTLSRRNLLALLHKLEMEGSARTIFSEGSGIDGMLVLHSETDAEHYHHPERIERGIAGEMHPLTETFINQGDAPE